MVKNIIVAIVLLFLGGCLQVILIGTSPRIDCDDLTNQLFLLLKSLSIEYLILACIQFSISKFVFKMRGKQLLVLIISFTLLYLLFFLFLFNSYSKECIQ